MTSNSVFVRSLQFMFSIGNLPRSRRGFRRNALTPGVLGSIEAVEDRCLLSGTNGAVFTGSNSGGGGPTGNSNPLTSIPVLNSRPGAPVTIFLDFDGHVTTDTDWTQGGSISVTTPVYDIDSDLTTFSDEELRRMEEIWYRVSEDYAPFDVNVTTVNPGVFNNFQAIHVSIGGVGTWQGGNSGGVAFLNAFNNGSSNICYVFTDNLGNGAAVPTAMNVSHEVGHTLGLSHHSQFDATGGFLQEYDPGSSRIGPIMGGAFSSERNIWMNAPTNVNITTFQDDLAVMTRAANQTFRFRADDHGDTIAAATRNTSNLPRILQNGVIEQNNDVDMFRFETNTGTVSFSARGLDVNLMYPGLNLNPGTNLDLALELLDANGNSVAIDNSGNSLAATISTSVAAGIYYLKVSGTGEYGAVGQFSLTADVIPLPVIPVMVGPTGEINELRPFFEWTTGSNADHYELQVDNLTSNVNGYYTSDVTGTSHLALTQFVQGSYQARVRTVAVDGTVSAWSNFTNFTIEIPAPAVPQITRPIGDITDSFPTFVWTGDTGTTSYTLWVNEVTNPSDPTRVIYRTSYADTSYVHFSPLKDGTYRAWVRAFNSVGEYSGWSTPVTFRIDSPVPTVPEITGPAAISKNDKPRITWTASEGTARYDLWVNNLTTGVARVISNANISHQTPYFDTPALSQGTYRAWVRAANGNDEFTKWSDPYTFTVDIQRPAVPSIIGPVGEIVNQTITTANPTFSWTAAARAVKYDLWVNNLTTGQAQIIRQQNLTGLSYVALNNLPQGNYRAWVRGINSADEVGEWSTVFVFNIDEPTPSLPTIVAPKANPAGSVENPNPTFVWTSEFDAPFYEFRLDDTTLNKTGVISVSNIAEKTYTIPNDKRLAEHIYVAFVRGVNFAGEKSDWSPAFRVRIDVPNPTTPTILAPKLTSKDTTPTFEWKLDPGSFRYEILVRDLERNETIVLQVKSYLVNSTDPTNRFGYYTLPDSQAFNTGTYRFWIRAFNAIGTASSWSAAQTFVISASLDLKDLKIVEPARLQAAEEFYADATATFYADPEVGSVSPVVMDDASVGSQMTQPVETAMITDAMSADMIASIMESLSDPASETSAMLSGAVFPEISTTAQSDRTTAVAASVLAMAMMPVRRKRRDE